MINTKKNVYILLFSLILILPSCWKDTKTETKKQENINVIWILKSWDPSKCKELWDEAKVKNCTNNVYLDQAITKRDPEICKNINIEEPKNRCISQVYFEKASEKSDKTICQKIPNKQVEESCENNIILNDAIRLKDPKLCESFKWDSNVCRDEIFYILARDDKEKKFCKKIKNDGKKGTCEWLFASQQPINTNTWIQLTWSWQ